MCEICGAVIDPDDCFEHECDLDALFAKAEAVPLNLKPIELDGGGYRNRDIIRACGSSVVRLRGKGSDLRYFKRLYCMKPFCPSCNKKGGRIAKKRIQAVYRRLPEKLKGIFLRQWVFTVPEKLREGFQSRDRLNQLIRSATKIIKGLYPDHGWVVYVHVTGEGGLYHPHVNFHVIEETGARWKESPERIEMAKRRWKMALTGIVGESIGQDQVVVEYGFRSRRYKMVHAIKYMSRAFFEYSDEMVDFLADELKGFQFLRFGGNMRNQRYNENKLDLKELSEAAGERLQFEEIISGREFDMQYMPWDLEEVSPGLYRETDLAYKKRTGKKRV